jgi:hypothetical protein
MSADFAGVFGNTDALISVPNTLDLRGLFGKGFLTTEYTEYTEKGIGCPQISQEYSEIQMH